MAAFPVDWRRPGMQPGRLGTPLIRARLAAEASASAAFGSGGGSGGSCGGSGGGAIGGSGVGGGRRPCTGTKYERERQYVQVKAGVRGWSVRVVQ